MARAARPNATAWCMSSQVMLAVAIGNSIHASPTARCCQSEVHRRVSSYCASLVSAWAACAQASLFERSRGP